MKKVSLALFLSACTLGGVAYAQERPPANTVVRITDPSAVARAEDNARAAQMSAERASAGMEHKHAPKMHKGMHPHHKHPAADGAAPASAPKS